MLPTLNEGGSPFLSIGQRSILTLVTVRFNIVVPSHRLGIPNFTSLNAQFSLTPRSSALLKNYLFVNLSKTQNSLTLKIMTTFFQIQNRSTRLIIILMFTCHHSWIFFSSDHLHSLMNEQGLGSILCGTGTNYSCDQLNMICWQFLVEGVVTSLLQWKDKAIPCTSQAQAYEVLPISGTRWWKLS